MSHERRLLIEKIQVYSAMLLCVLLMYFILWPSVTPSGIDRTASYFASGDIAKMLIAIAYYWGFCVLAGILTAITRVQGAMAAAMAGLAGVSMRSESLRFLINRNEGNLGALAANMLPELILWAVAIWIGTIIVRIVWLKAMSIAAGSGTHCDLLSKKADLSWILLGISSFGGKQSAQRAQFLGEVLSTSIARAIVAFFVLTIVLNKAIDPERGQIVFAMYAAFFLASLAVSWSDHVSDSDMSAMLGVVILAVIITVKMKMDGSALSAPLEWLGLKSWHLVLPVDWMAAGCFGSFTGRWMALRMFHDPPAVKSEDSLSTASDLSLLAETVISKTFNNKA